MTPHYNGAGNSFDLAGLTFELEIDADPAVGAITPGTFDPLAWGDTAFGDNTTAFGGGTIASAPIAGTNLGQNSLNYGFFPGLQAATNNFAAGEYTLTLRALSGSTVVGATQILVSAVPEPSAFLFGGLMSGVAGWSIRRSRDEA